MKLKLELDMAINKIKELTVQESVEKIEYEQAREVLAKRFLKAPIRGIVTEILLEEGERCEAGTPVIRVIDPRKCYLVSNTDPSFVTGLEEKNDVMIVFGQGENEVRKPGIVEYIAPNVDPASGLIRVKVLFDNSDLKIRPGVPARLCIGDGS